MTQSNYWLLFLHNLRKFRIRSTKRAKIDFLTCLFRNAINKSFSLSSTFASPNSLKSVIKSGIKSVIIVYF